MKQNQYAINDQTESSDQMSHEQFILQLIHHNDIPTLKELGINKYNMNFVEQINEIELDNKVTPLICATQLGKLEIVKLLLQNPTIDVDQGSEDNGHTPLIVACMTGNFEILMLLLDAGAEVNKPNQFFHTPFICCFQRLEEESNVFENRKICFKMAELCLQHGADIDWIVDKVKGYTLLMQLCSIKMDMDDRELQTNFEIIRFLIENGANMKLKTMKNKDLQELAKKHANSENIINLIQESKQIFFYNQKADFTSELKQQQQPDEKQKQGKSRSMMKYLAFCKN